MDPSNRDREVTREDLRAILDNLPALIGYWDRDLRNRMANRAYVEFFGLTPDEIHGRHIREVLGEELFARNHPFMERALAGEPQLFDRDIPTPSGELRSTQASYIPDVVDGEVRGFFVLVTDITARRRAEVALAAAEQRFRTLFESAPIGMFLVDERRIVVDANEGAAVLLGRTRDDVVGRCVDDVTHPDDVEASRVAFRELLSGQRDAYRLEKRYVRADGEVVHAQLDARLLEEPDGRRLALGQVQDISERRRHDEELRRLADHDALTGLLNRRGFTQALERQAARTARYGPAGALLVLDLDAFKAVNDVHGHATGDAVLVAVAARMRERLRESDVLARLGGDEFAVLLPEGGLAQAGVVAASLESHLQEVAADGGTYAVGASVGIAAFTGEGDGDDVLRRADQDMYQVKLARRGAPRRTSRGP